MKISTLAWIFLTLGLLTATSIYAEGCPPLALTSVQPSQGSPGDPVVLRGRGFCEPARAYFAWGFDGTRGFAFRVKDKPSRTRLAARLAPSHANVNGPVMLWEGQWTALPDATVAGGVYRIRNGRRFTPARTASGPSFHAMPGSAPGFSSRLIGGEVRLDLSGSGVVPAADGYQVEGDGDTISVVVVIETDGMTSGESSAYDLECTSEDASICQNNLEVALAESLSTAIADEDVKARAQGSTVILSHPSSIDAGFIDVTVPSAATPSRTRAQRGGVLTASSSARSASAISR